MLPNSIPTEKYPNYNTQFAKFPPKPTIQPKQNLEPQDIIIIRQPILPNSTITPKTDSLLMYIIIGAIVFGFVLLKTKDIV